ncbi:phosphoglycerate mutase 2-like [Aethina tumida]|uniref:phosphoglycerate mutase 2-like n=1 Tax=Aethina tumida TaxID=116153 RepID=UPI00096B13E1|nr:phosphoglycerate mutase 2-like [Aethina tumida]
MAACCKCKGKGRKDGKEDTKAEPCPPPKPEEPKELEGFKVIMVRHGESEWNQKNLFCGWVDVDLSDRGREEAVSAGKALKKECRKFDVAYTSVLRRAHQTLDGILQELRQTDIPIIKNWRLNERHYGGLTGLNKKETAEKYGAEQVQIWRRSFDTPPPPMKCDHPYFMQIRTDPIYKDGPSQEEFPKYESLKLTIQRTLPYWNDTIVPDIKSGKKVLIVAHGNSLRGIVKTLDDMSNEAIMELNLPTGIPFEYTLDQCMKPVPGGSMRFLGDPETVQKAMDEVKNQIKK